MASSVPKRWLYYSKIENVIPGTPFIACKTPLKKILEDEQRFTPEDLINHVKKLEKNLVGIIDLTNTTKYYNKDDFQSILHIKIFTPGHVIPGPEIISKFFGAVDLCKKNLGKDGVIAVHCTHGVNRTGYLVCKYMIDKLHFDPQKAIEEFNRARGHKIERENYLKDLKNEPLENFMDPNYSRKSHKMPLYSHEQQSMYYESTRQPYPNYQHQNFHNGYDYQNHPRYFAPDNGYDYQNHPRYFAPAEPYHYENSSFPYENNYYPPYQSSYPDPYTEQYYQSNHRSLNYKSTNYKYYSSSLRPLSQRPKRGRRNHYDY